MNKIILSSASPAPIDKVVVIKNPSSNVLVNPESAVAETENISPENIFIDQIRDQVGDKTLDDGNDDEDQEVDYDEDEDVDLARNFGQDEEIVEIVGTPVTLPSGQLKQSTLRQG